MFLSVEQKKRSTPLTQKWYRDKQQHISDAQRRAIREHWPAYGIDLKYGVPLRLNKSFKGLPYDSIVLDIGFGMGESLIDMALQRPTSAFLGCEIHRAGIGSALLRLTETTPAPQNVRIVRSDVTLLFECFLPDACLDEICVFFPDPWPNTERDGERRVIRDSMIALFETKLKIGGSLRMATDVKDYADHIMVVMASRQGRWRVDYAIEHDACCEDFAVKRPTTKYERRAKELGNRVWDFHFLLLPADSFS